MNRYMLILVLPVLLWANISDMNIQLRNSLNLGNYFEGPNEGDWGEILVEEDFTRIALKGFTAVRLPVRWSNHLNADTTIDTTFLNRVKWAVSQANQNGLTVVMNDHHFDSLFANYTDYEPVIKTVWKQLATEFQSIPDDSLFFELVNEPHGEITSDLWNTLIADLTNVIRPTNPLRPIVIGTTQWGGIAGLSQLALPNDSNLIVTVHYYSPMEFTHQGASWVTGADQWVGTEWLGGYFEKQAVREDVEVITLWQNQNSNIPIFIGEFGSYSTAAMSDREKWTHYCARLFEANSLSWAYWEYSSGFGLFNPSAQDWRDGLTDTLLSKDTLTLAIDSMEFALGANLVQNGDFSNDLTNWIHSKWNGGVASTSITNNGLTHTTETTGEDFFNIQLLQSGIVLDSGKQYLLKVELTGNDSTEVSVGLSRADYSQIASSGAKIIPSSGTSFNVVISPTQDESNTTMVINLGYTVGTVTISSVSIQEIQYDESAIYEQLVRQQPISFISQNNALQFSYDLPENCSIRLFSLRGQEILNLPGNNLTSLQLPSQMAPGWYAVVITELGRELLRGSFIHR